MTDLSGQRILVTGAAGGIGSATANRLEKSGATIIRTDLSGDELDHAVNLTNRAAVDAMVDDITHQHPLNGLVHCAAKCGVAGPFHAVDQADWNAYIDANLTGSFNVCQAVSRTMIAAKSGGRIVVVGSVNALAAEPANAPYVASKGGLRMLVKSMAVDLARYGIAANLVHPGAIEVPRNAHVLETGNFESLMHNLVPAAEAGTPDDVAKAVAFLVAPSTSYITGAELAVDGGLMAQLLGRKDWPDPA